MEITDKILGIRRNGFKVVPRAEFDARFPNFLTEPGAYVIHSDEWVEGGKPDSGMVDVGDDAVILEAAFAEVFYEDEEFDEWFSAQPEEYRLAAIARMESAIKNFVKQKRRSHLRVVE